MRSRHLFRALVLFFVVLSAGALPVNAQSDTDAVNAFKKYIAVYEDSYRTDHREQVVHSFGGWSRRYFELTTHMTIDVQKSNSLISPYLGVAIFNLTLYQTAYYPTKDAAEGDHNFIQKILFTHRHTYAYQEGVWVPTERKYSNAGTDGNWYTCDGPWWGCFEPNFDQ